MNPNPFQRVGLDVVPSARRHKSAKEKAKAALVPKTALEKAQAAKDKLWEQYLAELEKRRKVLTSGPYAGTAEALVAFLKTLTMEDGDKLIEMAMVWQGAPSTTRFLVLQLIDEAMINLREMNGLAPFDDPIDPNETNAFLTIKKLLS